MPAVVARKTAATPQALNPDKLAANSLKQLKGEEGPQFTPVTRSASRQNAYPMSNDKKKQSSGNLIKQASVGVLPTY